MDIYVTFTPTDEISVVFTTESEESITFSDSVSLYSWFDSEDGEAESLFTAGQTINADFESTITVGDYDIYDGEYLVTPQSVNQILNTEDKLMLGDVMVAAVPYKVTENQYGSTVTIL